MDYSHVNTMTLEQADIEFQKSFQSKTIELSIANFRPVRYVNSAFDEVYSAPEYKDRIYALSFVYDENSIMSGDEYVTSYKIESSLLEEHFQEFNKIIGDTFRTIILLKDPSLFPNKIVFKYWTYDKNATYREIQLKIREHEDAIYHLQERLKIVGA